MPRTVDYHCEYRDKDRRTPEEIEKKVPRPDPCDFTKEELMMDSEGQPENLTIHSGEVCEKCGGQLVKSLNLKNNSQVWGVNKL